MDQAEALDDEAMSDELSLGEQDGEHLESKL
jgi:hypothetical protein